MQPLSRDFCAISVTLGGYPLSRPRVCRALLVTKPEGKAPQGTAESHQPARPDAQGWARPRSKRDMTDLMTYRPTPTRREILLAPPRQDARTLRAVPLGVELGAGELGVLDRFVAVAGELRRGIRARVHRAKHRPARRRVARIVCFVPAHNEEADIARTLDALLTQTRRIDRIVVILDNCTDKHRGDRPSATSGVTVMRTVDNQRQEGRGPRPGVEPVRPRLRLHARRRRRHRAGPGLRRRAGGRAGPQDQRRRHHGALHLRRAARDVWWSRQLIRAQRMDFARG